MSKMFLKLSAGLAVLAVAGSVLAQSAASRQLSGHVPAVTAHLSAHGRVPGTNWIHLAIGLPVHNQNGLDAMLSQVTDPSSPNYRHFLSAQEFADQFSPSPQDYQAVTDFAQANGFKVSRNHANRMILEVDGKVADVEKAFGVKLQTYQHPTENREFFAPDVEPSVPSQLPVLEIGGLNNYARPHPHVHVKPSVKTSVGKHLTGSGPLGSYIGNDFRAAYVPGASQTGAGQNVALVQFDGYNSNDITQYELLTGRPAVSLTNILLSGFNGVPTGNGGEVEVSLDIEMVISMAPAINQVLLYEGNPDVFLPNVVLNRIATDNAARQVSCSWGWTGGPSAISDQIFKEMALQGQTFCVAAGDSCSYPNGTVDNPAYFGCPSDSPYVTSVGGTTLTTSGPGGAYVSETVWNWGIEFGSADDGIGSSGAISSYYSIPSWQQGISMTNNGGSTVNRNMPDVTLTGDNVYVIADSGVGYPGVGGTSCASPLWAAFIALVNQQAASNGTTYAGFINPALYSLAKGSQYHTVFNDITTGNDTWSGNPSQFYAVSGYDLASGLGSPAGTNMINALAGTTNSGGTVPVIISAPLPPWGNTLSVMNGSNPNGAWFLFVQDDKVLDVGMIDNGWSLALTTGSSLGTPADVQITAPATLSISQNTTSSLVLAVTNYGPVTATNVAVVDAFPSDGLTLVSVAPTNGVTIYGNSILWNPGNLPVNTGSSLTLNFTGSVTGTYTNTPTESATTYDPNPDDKSAATLVTVTTPPAPVLSAQILPSGNKTSFYFTVSNSTGYTTIIQATTNLLSPNWVNVFTDTAPYVTNVDVVTNFPARFYRAVLQTQ